MRAIIHRGTPAAASGSADRRSEPGAHRGEPAGQIERRRRVPTTPLLGAAAVTCSAGAAGVALAGISAPAAASVAAFTLAASGAGWLLGERARAKLEDDVERRTRDLKRALSELEIAQAETVQRLSMAVEFRDEDTGSHIERIGRFSVLLAEHIGMDSDFCERLRHAAPLHDVGKVAIPDAILLKPGPLTPEERAIVETHAEEGHRLVRGSSSSILDMAATIALSHQEKWDGSGYPRGLKGEAIPIESRIVAVVDVFDALTSDRVYRKAFSVEEAVQMMREQRGRHFDPVLLDAFMEVLGENGPDARQKLRSDPNALIEHTLETFATALQRGDAETAEGAIASAIEEGIHPRTLHGEVIAPSLRRLERLSAAGEVGEDAQALAQTITRRVLATLRRFMTGGIEPTRARVLVAVLSGDRHELGMQMVHDQLAAAGFATSIATGLSPARLGDAVEELGAEALVVGSPGSFTDEELALALADLSLVHPGTRVLLAESAVGGELVHGLGELATLERIDEAPAAVEGLLHVSTRGASV